MKWTIETNGKIINNFMTNKNILYATHTHTHILKTKERTNDIFKKKTLIKILV